MRKINGNIILHITIEMLIVEGITEVNLFLVNSGILWNSLAQILRLRALN